MQLVFGDDDESTVVILDKNCEAACVLGKANRIILWWSRHLAYWRNERLSCDDVLSDVDYNIRWFLFL